MAAPAAFVAALAGCGKPVTPPIDPQHVAAKIQSTLPKPYVDGLVIQRAHAQGKRLVFDLRIPYASIDTIDLTKLPAMHQQELVALNNAICHDPDLEHLLERHYEISRRFLDRNGKQVIEVVASNAPYCPTLR
ncbi:MAG: hypothetical protein JSR26_09860 [Proteobacteria bacterium]|nr:hypothetical protein [Pseudomonadota bacterium]